MKKFGLIGGTSWHSTIEYYSLINEQTNKIFKNNSNPPLRLINLSQKEIHDLQRQNDWDSISKILTNAALELQSLQVEAIAFCANTPHRLYDQVQANINVPILHIADAIGKNISQMKQSTVGLMGTIFTMEGDFIRGPLRQKYAIETLVPEPSVRMEIQRILYEELSHGTFSNKTQQFFLNIINDLISKGAQSVIMGCTEFPILLADTTSSVPLINSTQCHTKEIVDFILEKI